MSDLNERTLRLDWVLKNLPWSISKQYFEMYDIPSDLINGVYETREYPDTEWDLENEMDKE